MRTPRTSLLKETAEMSSNGRKSEAKDEDDAFSVNYLKIKSGKALAAALHKLHHALTEVGQV